MQEFQDETARESYRAVLREILDTSKEVVRNEIHLAKTEAKSTVERFASHASQLAAFGALFLLSVPPFVAFLVIGLGELLEGRYWLSALLVSLTFAAVGGILAFRALRQLKKTGVRMPATQRTLAREAELIGGKVENIRNATR